MIQIYCGHCGSANVNRDAWAEWDTERQKWTLGPVYDDGHCEVCEGESSLEEAPLEEWEQFQNGTQVLENLEYRAEELANGDWKAVISDENVGVIGEVTTDWAGGRIFDRDEALDEARRAIMQEKFRA